MHVTIFRGAKETRPIAAEDLPWPGLVQEFDGALDEVAPRKTELLAFGPYRLRDGAARGDANVVERTLIALDSDNGAAPQGYVDRLRDLGLAGFVYATAGDSPAKRKCRVVVPLASPLPPSEAREAMIALAEVLGMRPGCGVEKTLDPSRIYFLGHVIGTPRRDRWTIEGEPLDPSVLPAPSLAWSASNGARARAERPPRSSDKPPVDDDVLARAVAVAERVPPSVEGHGGDAALFHAVREIATVTGPDYAAIRTALSVFNERCLPPWDTRKLDREAARAAEAQDSLANRTLRRVSKHARPEAEAEAEAEADEPENAQAAILTTPKGKTIWVYDPTIEGYREILRDNLVVMLRTTGADAYIEMTGPRGGQLSAATIIDQNARQVDDAIADYRSPAPGLYDREANRLRIGILCPRIEPQEDPRVALWLDAIAGDEIEAVKQWIASTRQDTIHRLATALCLIGPYGTGKTVFAQVCARLWGAPPVELDNVAAQFNAAMASCPVVVDDECKCLARRNLTTEQFRVLVQARERLYEPKGLERRPLLGAQRFVITANDLRDIQFANALGRGAVDALAERLTVIQIDDEQAELARAALDAVRLSSGDLDWDALAGHFQWIRETVPLPDERVRFLGQNSDRARARRAVVAHAVEADGAVYERIASVATGTTASADAIFIEHGALWVHVKALAEILHLSTGAEKWDVARVQRSLEPIRGKREYVWRSGKTVRAREIDVGRLIEFCELDAEAVRRTLGGG